MTRLTGHNSIAGAWSAQGNETFTSVDPRTRQSGNVLFHNTTAGEIDRAVTAAAEAFKETRHYSASQIAAFLDTAADEIEKLRDELIATADYETALGSPRLPGELTRTTGQLRRGQSVQRAEVGTDVHRFIPHSAFKHSAFRFTQSPAPHAASRPVQSP